MVTIKLGNALIRLIKIISSNQNVIFIYLNINIYIFQVLILITIPDTIHILTL